MFFSRPQLIGLAPLYSRFRQRLDFKFAPLQTRSTPALLRDYETTYQASEYGSLLFLLHSRTSNVEICGYSAGRLIANRSVLKVALAAVLRLRHRLDLGLDGLLLFLLVCRLDFVIMVAKESAATKVIPISACLCREQNVLFNASLRRDVMSIILIQGDPDQRQCPHPD
jgi:hypothetical protein